MRFHVPCLPHTLPTKEYCHCAYSEKIRKFDLMMASLGHELVLYPAVDPDPPADYLKCKFDATSPRWIAHNAKCIVDMAHTIQPDDFICLIAGECQKLIADAFPNNMVVEFGIGYNGVFAPYRVYESYAHMARTNALHGVINGRFFDAVIPNYYDVSEFPAPEHDKNNNEYLLFMARLNWDKGIQVAVQVAEATSRKLVVCGIGDAPKSSVVDYRGLVGSEERGRLMSNARALIMPSLYFEPFGGVVVEAQLCGTPVITTDWGAFPETVVDGISGYRCHYLGEFIQAVDHVKHLYRTAIRERAVDNWDMNLVKFQYSRYFKRLELLRGKGWDTI